MTILERLNFEYLIQKSLHDTKRINIRILVKEIRKSRCYCSYQDAEKIEEVLNDLGYVVEHYPEVIDAMNDACFSVYDMQSDSVTRYKYKEQVEPVLNKLMRNREIAEYKIETEIFDYGFECSVYIKPNGTVQYRQYKCRVCTNIN